MLNWIEVSTSLPGAMLALDQHSVEVPGVAEVDHQGLERVWELWRWASRRMEQGKSAFARVRVCLQDDGWR